MSGIVGLPGSKSGLIGDDPFAEKSSNLMVIVAQLGTPKALGLVILGLEVNLERLMDKQQESTLKLADK